MSEEEKKPEPKAEAEGGTKTDAGEAAQPPAGGQPAVAASEASPGGQAEAAKENAEDAQDRGVKANPGEVAETVKELASDSPAAAPAAAPDAGAGGEAAAPADP
jgi:hypothetical protein